jgi:PAS domain S-box-containing protein
LRESEQRYRSVIENASEGIVVAQDSFLVYANNRALEMIGVGSEEAISRPFTEYIHPDDRTLVFERYQHRINGERVPQNYDFRILRNNGKILWVQISAVWIVWNNKPATLNFLMDITDRKLAEEKLRESEERYTSLFNRSLDCIYIHDLEGNFLDANASALELLGYSREEIPLLSFATLLSPDQMDTAVDTTKTIVQEGSHSGLVEYRLLCRDGRFVDIETRATLIVHEGKPCAILGIAQDITSQKRADAERKAYETRLESAMEIGSLAWWEMDLPGGKVRFDDRKATMLGYSRETFRHYTDFTRILHPDDYELTMLAMNDHLEGKQVKYHADYRLLTSEGTYRWFRDIGGITGRHPDGSPSTVTGIVIDITTGREVEEALRDNQVRLATAMDIAGLVNWEYDVQSGMFSFNDRFYALYETTAEREGGYLMPAEVYMREFVYPDDRPEVLAAIQELLATTDADYSGQTEHRITPRDGSIRTIIARYAPVMGPDGTVIRTYGANQDITDSKLMESEIRSLNTVLEQRVKERTEALVETNEKLEEENAQRLEAEGKLRSSYDEKVMLLKEIHHRVKNNLQIIASLLNLQSRYISDAKTLAAIRESQNRVKAMALVHEKLYRSEDISHISLHDYIRFLGTGLFQFYDAKIRGIQFSLDIHDVNVDIDAAIPLGLILNELISNSLKYAFPEERKGEVAISVQKEGHTLTVLYRDTGIGIPADLDWRNTQSLGLRLVTTLVDQMNGTVELDRSSGTLFTMVVHEKEGG